MKRKIDFKANLIFDKMKPMTAYKTAEDGLSYPVTLDMRDLVLKTEDQGATDMCAAYTATSWIESILWRKTGKPVDFDPKSLYAKAKTIDGMPNTPGTTLDAVLYAMIDLGWIPGGKRDDVVLFYTANQLKRAIHRYGTCLLGFSITEKWTKHFGRLVFSDASGRNLGGHAVICTGYNDVGVFIQNSWGEDWGKYGFACLSWDLFNKQFIVGAYMKNCLNDIEAK